MARGLWKVVRRMAIVAGWQFYDGLMKFGAAMYGVVLPPAVYRPGGSPVGGSDPTGSASRRSRGDAVPPSPRARAGMSGDAEAQLHHPPDGHPERLTPWVPLSDQERRLRSELR